MTIKTGLLTGEGAERREIPPASKDSATLANVSAKRPPRPTGGRNHHPHFANERFCSLSWGRLCEEEGDPSPSRLQGGGQ